MNHMMDRLFLFWEVLGGILLFAAACASDGGLPLSEILWRVVLAGLLLGMGVLGRMLCKARGRAWLCRMARVRQARPAASGCMEKSETCA
ncbi:MAG: hypothetical protein VB086_01875 [Clostridiaceae bacterium]|nr:hypothetical protein [Clostridiaceae bacterium]